MSLENIRSIYLYSQVFVSESDLSEYISTFSKKLLKYPRNYLTVKHTNNNKTEEETFINLNEVLTYLDTLEDCKEVDNLVNRLRLD